jgi:hypothetical protein
VRAKTIDAKQKKIERLSNWIPQTEIKAFARRLKNRFSALPACPSCTIGYLNTKNKKWLITYSFTIPEDLRGKDLNDMILGKPLVRRNTGIIDIAMSYLNYLSAKKNISYTGRYDGFSSHSECIQGKSSLTWAITIAITPRKPEDASDFDDIFREIRGLHKKIFA